jgi:hypothetical protein
LRPYVLVFLCIGTGRIEYVACTSNPDSAWMAQQARNLLMDLDDRSQRPRFLIHDRDAKFSRAYVISLGHTRSSRTAGASSAPTRTTRRRPGALTSAPAITSASARSSSGSLAKSHLGTVAK